MKIIESGTVFCGTEGRERSSACFPAVCTMPDGRVLVGFRASPKKSDALPQRVLITSSGDEGRSWSEPVEPFSAPSLAGTLGHFRAVHLTPLGRRRLLAVLYWVDASRPALPFFNPETEGIKDSQICLALSEDGGETWSEPRAVDTSPFTMPLAITGPVLLSRGGEWALQFETNKAYDDTSPWHHAAVLMFSRDEGRTWPEHVTVAADPEGRIFYWDQRPAVLGDGRVLAVFWTFDRQEARYLNIHGRSSTDSGRTWSELWDTGVPGQPAPPVSLPDGRAAMPYMDRTGPPVVKMRLSPDAGRTWPQHTELVLDARTRRAEEGGKSSMQDAWAEMGQYSIGLPRAALLPDGELLVVYYAGSHPDHTAICWVRVRP